MAHMQPLLELKTLPWLRPIDYSFPIGSIPLERNEHASQGTLTEGEGSVQFTSL